MKLAVVVQRYGADINGGAEQHARYIAERLARHHDVEVLTTCARDYVTWADDHPAGTEVVHGITVRRFPVDRPRDPDDFARWSALVFDEPHSIADELGWLRSEGPTSSALIRHISGSAGAYDYFVFFSYRYHQAWHGARAVPSKAILVPTAERDAAVGLAIFGPLFRGVRAIMYNSFEEREMIGAVAGGPPAPGVVVGVGSEIPQRVEPHRFRRRHRIDGRFVIYVGRIDENKGCRELFANFDRYVQTTKRDLTLVLVGHAILPVPSNDRIRHLGFLSDEDKFDGIAAAEALIMPSYFESLSMVALEAWGLGRPVLANGRCDVLRGQCMRSNAGLYYESPEEFVEALFGLESSESLNRALGQNGAEYYRTHYAWPEIERKYLDMLTRLADEDRRGSPSRAMDALPGWWARRRATCPPARRVVDGLPSGPVVPTRRPSSRPRDGRG